MCPSGENLARSEDRKCIMRTSPFKWAGLERQQPLSGIHAYFTPASPLKRVFYWAQFYLTGLGEICPAFMHHSPTKLRAVEDKPQPHLSLKGITGARRNAIRNDAELSYCVNAQLPDDATAPKVMRVESPNCEYAVGVFLPKILHSPKVINVVMTCYVYVIQAWGFMKIGMSSDPDKRLKEMQTGCPDRMQVIARLVFKSRQEARACEQKLHWYLKPYHYRGEWFRASCRDQLFKIPNYKIENWRSKRGISLDIKWVTPDDLEAEKLKKDSEMQELELVAAARAVL